MNKEAFPRRPGVMSGSINHDFGIVYERIFQIIIRRPLLLQLQSDMSNESIVSHRTFFVFFLSPYFSSNFLAISSGSSSANPIPKTPPVDDPATGEPSISIPSSVNPDIPAAPGVMVPGTDPGKSSTTPTPHATQSPFALASSRIFHSMVSPFWTSGLSSRIVFIGGGGGARSSSSDGERRRARFFFLGTRTFSAPSVVGRVSIGSVGRVVGIEPGDVGSVFTTGWRVK